MVDATCESKIAKIRMMTDDNVQSQSSCRLSCLVDGVLIHAHKVYSFAGSEIALYNRYMTSRLEIGQVLM
jgi:hypothetical protein